MVYQPHRYTRTRDLFQDFCKVLSTPDKLFLLESFQCDCLDINHRDIDYSYNRTAYKSSISFYSTACVFIEHIFYCYLGLSPNSVFNSTGHCTLQSIGCRCFKHLYLFIADCTLDMGILSFDERNLCYIRCKPGNCVFLQHPVCSLLFRRCFILF